MLHCIIFKLRHVLNIDFVTFFIETTAKRMYYIRSHNLHLHIHAMEYEAVTQQILQKIKKSPNAYNWVETHIIGVKLLNKYRYHPTNCSKAPVTCYRKSPVNYHLKYSNYNTVHIREYKFKLTKKKNRAVYFIGHWPI